MEYPTDELLVNLVRIQRLAQSISLSFSFRGSGLQVDLPVSIIVKSFQQQLESFKTLLPEHLRDHSELSSVSSAEECRTAHMLNSFHCWSRTHCRDFVIRDWLAK